jgi:hypothetical protein
VSGHGRALESHGQEDDAVGGELVSTPPYFARRLRFYLTDVLSFVNWASPHAIFFACFLRKAATAGGILLE